ncbi:hypothetical protein P872_02525 [Rhodonellum psychrophilum GCM71 = DSM 17998]|uniref:DoxX family protein n=2 Tax=Rhodonellum TaxID=336827 RepID=U5C0T4_9BACT|nr:DoxX family membrane protein [Rhodonellum ikkaensis]ERM83693.1 hypothetical protein P872_02525 [Rhodonellum psychrophilum GCM71 = DSM 17998]SDY90466.1 Uncharacterized membrane protein [Rhodonellum ikkaensis]
MKIDTLQHTSHRTNLAQNIARVILGGFLVMAGTSHLSWSRAEFLAQVPSWLPIDADLVVILSGVVEIILGLSLLFFTSRRRQVGWVVAAFFVLIFPGNISQYMNGIDAFGLDTDRARAIRLVFQPVLVLLALWSTGAWQAWRKQQSGD